MVISIHLLGGFEVRSEGGSVALPARKSQALLALLARRPGVPLSREWLAALLWPEAGTEQARTSLRQALGHLRRELPSALLVSALDQLYLEPGAAHVDVVELDRALDQPPVQRERAAELYTGTLLEGFAAVTDPFADWLSAEQLQLRDRVMAGLEACLGALSSAGQLERALALAARLTSIDPTSERAYETLMRLHLARGERASALRVYQLCREQLERRLGVPPGASLEQLRSQALEPARTASTDSAEPTGARSFGVRTVLAILPFEAHPAAGGAHLLAGALSEDLTTELGRFPQLALISRASVGSILGRGADARALAEETGARLLLSGSVRVLESSEDARGARARVTAALRDAITGLQLWAERWEIALSDLSGALDRLTRSVAGALALSIDEVRLSRARRRPRERLEAYECWLCGLERVRRGAPGFDEEARSFFEQALALEPSFARAHAGLSLAHFNDWSCQAWERWDERERAAFEHAKRAVALDESDPVTHCILGRIYLYRREFALGEHHLNRALALNQNDADVLLHAAIGFTQLGDPQRGRELADGAFMLHPKHPDWYCAAAALPRFFQRRVRETVELAARAPDAFVDTRALLAAACSACDTQAAAVHLGCFLEQFRTKITRGAAYAQGEPLRWLLKVNPLRRAEDVAYLRESLLRAGLS
jgi:DNA-binding SARP family transcriptional activator